MFCKLARRSLLILVGTVQLYALTLDVVFASVTLSWKDNSSNEKGFTIERRSGKSGSYDRLLDVGANKTSYTDVAVSSGTKYCYRIYAYNEQGKSGHSNESCVTAAAPKPSSVTVNLTIDSKPSQTTAPARASAANGDSSSGTDGAAVARAGDKIGVYRQSTGEWLLDRNGSATWDGCSIDFCSQLSTGAAGAPVVGDWNQSGTANLGSFVAETNEAFLDRNGNHQWDGCKTDLCMTVGENSKNVAVVGKWNGAEDQIAFFDPERRRWNLQGTGACKDGCYEWPVFRDGDIPIVGDWNGDGGTDLGLFRPSSGEWFLDRNGDRFWRSCTEDICVKSFGLPGDVPVAGDWNGTGAAKIGVFRATTGEWFLDMNGNLMLDEPGVDFHILGYGQTGDLPIVGNW